MFWIISPKLLELFHTRTISQLWISAVKWSCQRNLSAAIFSGRFSGGLTMPCDVNRKHGIWVCYTRLILPGISITELKVVVMCYLTFKQRQIHDYIATA